MDTAKVVVAVLVWIARYYVAAYGYYGGRRVAALRFLYKVRYRIGLYDHAMRGFRAEGVADRGAVGVEAVR